MPGASLVSSQRMQLHAEGVRGEEPRTTWVEQTTCSPIRTQENTQQPARVVFLGAWECQSEADRGRIAVAHGARLPCQNT